ncbi:MAG: GFA family protein [Hyphomicrobiales bacterium]|nr:GFA family protein [Hyphomicrobiales bacterium]
MSDVARGANTGRCMCGDIRLEYLGDPIETGHCHCESCRRHTCAPFITYVVINKAAFRYTRGGPAVYQSSPGVERTHCARCGSPISYENANKFALFVGVLDDPSLLTPERLSSWPRGCQDRHRRRPAAVRVQRQERESDGLRGEARRRMICALPRAAGDRTSTGRGAGRRHIYSRGPSGRSDDQTATGRDLRRDGRRRDTTCLANIPIISSTGSSCFGGQVSYLLAARPKSGKYWLASMSREKVSSTLAAVRAALPLC